MSVVRPEQENLLKKNEPTSSEEDIDTVFVLRAILVAFMLIFFAFTAIMYYQSISARSPRFSIEAITASYINISWTTCGNTFLAAQDLAVDFVVENPVATIEVEYNNVEVMVSHKGDTIWVNTLGLYHQGGGGRTSIRVPFANVPVKIREIESAMITCGYGVFTVGVKGKYNSNTFDLSCGDVEFNFSSPTRVLPGDMGSPIHCQ